MALTPEQSLLALQHPARDLSKHQQQHPLWPFRPPTTQRPGDIPRRNSRRPLETLADLTKRRFDMSKITIYHNPN